ncbi:hypothetical protein L6452_08323 [Arctium lappa]|uniref:Uncharacterized protein n=1 Tax=Arctium lappa TaxID=4217 RepID=A0ACB9DH68_ARCLA|nr:hypothetical protein L6452_08323 [Arctium lappa]
MDLTCLVGGHLLSFLNKVYSFDPFFAEFDDALNPPCLDFIDFSSTNLPKTSDIRIVEFRSCFRSDFIEQWLLQRSKGLRMVP